MKYENPIYKVIKSSTPDILTSSIEDIDNKRVSVAEIFDTNDFQEENFFI